MAWTAAARSPGMPMSNPVSTSKGGHAGGNNKQESETGNAQGGGGRARRLRHVRSGRTTDRKRTRDFRTKQTCSTQGKDPRAPCPSTLRSSTDLRTQERGQTEKTKSATGRPQAIVLSLARSTAVVFRVFRTINDRHGQIVSQCSHQSLHAVGE